MSVQFGRWGFDGAPPDADYLAKVRKLISPYGPDGGGSYSASGIGVLCYAFHTNKESRSEAQPLVSASGTVLTWDGRLDNRDELLSALDGVVSNGCADVSIASAAFTRWGTSCFAKMIGDWTLSIWDANNRALILAKDPIGTRHLYYAAGPDGVTWSTILDPLVLFAPRHLALDEEYIAGWLSMFPATHLTPYAGVCSVPPSSFVRVTPTSRATHKYWDLDPGKRISHRSDAQYEEHFRFVFGQSVKRRLRSDAPVLAELSGGMDSSSIVCMADDILARGEAETPRLDTVSYFDDAEPNWNERPYFTKVEERRGRAGHHIDVGTLESLPVAFEDGRFLPTPAAVAGTTERAKHFADWMRMQPARVLLSGVGGDEVLGGVPTPLPELEDLLASLQFRALVRQLEAWALAKRRPWVHLLLEATARFLPPTFAKTPRRKQPAPWLDRGFVRRNRAALRGYERRLRVLGPRPSFQDNLATLDGLRRQLGCAATNPCAIYETRYPYLDRDLLEFLFAIPREQLVRPGQRRSLMRRALRGIVPPEVLERKRKAFVSRSPLAAIGAHWAEFAGLTHSTAETCHGILDAGLFRDTMEKACRGQEVSLPTALRTLGIQAWLLGMGGWQVCEREAR
jgi:asparagine synthase (glutamine-hydrolysing)